MRWSVVFKQAGRVTWERVVVAEKPAEAVMRAREMAEWPGVDVQDHRARAREL